MPKLVAIQALRALAALAVVMLHALYELRFMPGASPAGMLDHLPWEAGVDVFFVISGFVMVVASRSMFGRAGARGRFLAHRIARIVPLYWLTTTVYLVLALAVPRLVREGRPDWPYVAASYLFWPASRQDGTTVPLFSLGWTLNYEMFFYALFAIGLGWRPRLAVAGIAVALLAVITVAALGAPNPIGFWGGSIVLEFALGMAVGLARIEGVAIGRPVGFALVVAGAAAFAAQDAMPVVARWIAFGWPAACLVAGAALGPARRSEAVRAARWLALAGDASYALYLTHPFLVRGLRQAWAAAGLPAQAAPFIVIALAGSLLLAVALHLAVERPLTLALRRRLEAVAPAPVPAPTR